MNSYIFYLIKISLYELKSIINFKVFKIIILIIKKFCKWGLGIGDWGFGIGDWGIGPKPQPPNPNPQPPTPNIIFKKK